MILGIVQYSGQPASTSFFGQRTYYADLAYYRPQIEDAVALPEPDRMLAPGGALLGWLGARRRRAAAGARRRRARAALTRGRGPSPSPRSWTVRRALLLLACCAALARAGAASAQAAAVPGRGDAIRIGYENAPMASVVADLWRAPRACR